jgi:prepilin-type N-terminal cleavage/methylation domain-containing protein
MRKRQGFTLIELLVVIAIIALLLAILMSALSRVKKQAKATACQMNLHQWAVVWSMYTGVSDGYFPRGPKPNIWYVVTKPYYKDEALRFCPMVTERGQAQVLHSRSEATNAADGGFLQTDGTSSYASYGINNWVYNPTFRVLWSYEAVNHWKNANVKGADNIPLFLDVFWRGGHPRHTNAPPDYNGSTHRSGPVGMRRFCMDRHGGVKNILFLNFSVRKVGIKELWKLKWHREFDTNGPWTKAGGVQPEDWPQWMRGFKDYQTAHKPRRNLALSSDSNRAGRSGCYVEIKFLID